MKKIFISFSIIILTACSSMYYDEYYKLDANYLKQRQVSTRYFETNNEKELRIASVQLLQDLGYIISESNTQLGYVTAHKEREALNDAQKAALVTTNVLLALFGGTPNNNYPVAKQFIVTLVTSKSNTRQGYNVRVEFASVTFYSQGNSVVQRNTDEKTYQEFFEKLGQSVFLTPNDI